MKKNAALMVLCVGALLALPACKQCDEKKKAKKVAVEKTRVRKELIEAEKTA